MEKYVFSEKKVCHYGDCSQVIDAGRALHIGPDWFHPLCEEQYRRQKMTSGGVEEPPAVPVWIEYRWRGREAHNRRGTRNKVLLIEGSGQVKFAGAVGRSGVIYGMIIPSGGGSVVFYKNFPGEIKRHDNVRYVSIRKSKNEKTATAMLMDKIDWRTGEVIQEGFTSDCKFVKFREMSSRQSMVK